MKGFLYWKSISDHEWLSDGGEVSKTTSHTTICIFFFFNIYLWLYWVFAAAHSCGEQGLSSLDVWASHCSGLSCCGARALGRGGFSSRGLKVLEHRLGSCTGLAALMHVRSSQIRDRTCVFYISRQILNHWATREASYGSDITYLTSFLHPRIKIFCGCLIQGKIVKMINSCT